MPLLKRILKLSVLIDQNQWYRYQPKWIVQTGFACLRSNLLWGGIPTSCQQMWLSRFLLLLMILTCTVFKIRAQSWLIPRDTFDRARFITVASAGTAIYGATVIGLNQAWYKGFDRTSFHFFNDWREWNNMDKMGHLFTAYFETELSYRGTKWTGIRDPSAVWLASAMGILYQSTIEIFDAHSARWGFSVYDMVYNLAGTGLFAWQQHAWSDQRIRMKFSSWPKKYPTEPFSSQNNSLTSTLESRAIALFGENYFERLLKDYNAQTIWISFNIKSFAPKLNIPPWINLAWGFGSENLFGGFSNSWSEGNSLFLIDEQSNPRFKQWYLSPDIDFRKIKTNKPLVKTIFNVLNIFKIPAPALEYNGKRKFIWHWMFL